MTYKNLKLESEQLRSDIQNYANENHNGNWTEAANSLLRAGLSYEEDRSYMRKEMGITDD